MLTCSLARGALLAAIWSGGLTAQTVVCPSGVLVPYFGWDATECGNCNVYDTYLEYLTPPGLRSIRASGPASGRVQENDTLLAVEGSAITTPAAWQQMRDAEPGRAIHFLLRRRGDTTTATIIPSTRCVPEQPSQHSYRVPPRIGPVSRSIIVGGAIVDISGDPASVTYNPQTNSYRRSSANRAYALDIRGTRGLRDSPSASEDQGNRTLGRRASRARGRATCSIKLKEIRPPKARRTEG